MASVKENLVVAKAKIADPKNWVKNGGNCTTTFCAATTLIVTADAPASWGALWEALPNEAKNNPGFGRIADVFRYNDHPDTTHTDIMALFDRAIEASE